MQGFLLFGVEQVMPALFDRGSPHIGQALARFHGIAARDAVEMQPVVDVNDGALAYLPVLTNDSSTLMPALTMASTCSS